MVGKDAIFVHNISMVLRYTHNGIDKKMHVSITLINEE